jgi:hypothetical protein
MSQDRRRSLTERVTVNFSPAQLERLDHVQRHGETLGGFIRRAALEKLDCLGIPVEKGLAELVQHARRDVKPGSR